MYKKKTFIMILTKLWINMHILSFMKQLFDNKSMHLHMLLLVPGANITLPSFVKPLHTTSNFDSGQIVLIWAKAHGQAAMTHAAIRAQLPQRIHETSRANNLAAGALERVCDVYTNVHTHFIPFVRFYLLGIWPFWRMN